MATAPKRKPAGNEKQTARTARLEARLTAEQKALIERAAAYTGSSVTDFVVGAIAAAAHAVIDEQETIRLSQAESRRFVAALLKPSKPNAALRKAKALYAKSVESR